MKSNNLTLGVRFGFIIGIILFLFSAFFSLILYQYLKTQVIKDAREKTVIIMTQVKALGGYVKEELRPKMFELLSKAGLEESFVAEAMSSTHVNLHVMKRFNKELPDYIYKRVSDTPLNHENRTDEFHRQMLDYFRRNRTDLSWKGLVTAGKQQSIIYVIPIVADRSCLACHGEKAAALKAIVDRYGDSGSFGWKENTVVGVESVSIPLTVAFAHIRQTAIDTFVFGTSTLGILFFALTGIFKFLVTAPLNNLSRFFRSIAKGEEPLGKKMPIDRHDEIGDLTESFNILAKHLLDAQERLKRTTAIEKQIMETEKLAALGQLSAGVAHEINNPLGGIRLCFNNLLNTEMSEEARRQHVDTITKGFDRIQNIVKQLLSFSKNTPLSIAPSSINTIIENVLSLTEYVIAKKGIRLVKGLSEIPDLMVDANKLEQVFLNLIINAVQAMESGGTLTIRSWSRETTCTVSVSDTGKGIPRDIISKIYDPFFTTKEVGEGTGLGLTVSKAIIEQHKGSITVETSGEGTTFTVTLPIAP
ncbi:MAG: c-type heme family protein [Nitrospirota bacterium]